MGVDPPVNGNPIIFSPETFARHREAVEYTEGLIRTRDPRRGLGRWPGIAPGAWGLLASGSSITAASGTTLGTGTVTISDRAGTTGGDSVTVYNAGGALSGPALIPLEWTAGDWSVCGCSSPRLGCTPIGIPLKDLTVSWVNIGHVNDGSLPMVYTPGPPAFWLSGCNYDDHTFRLECVFDGIQFTMSEWNGGTGCTGIPFTECNNTGGVGGTLTLADYTDSPFHLHFQIPGVDCTFFSAEGYADIYVDE